MLPQTRCAAAGGAVSGPISSSSNIWARSAGSGGDAAGVAGSTAGAPSGCGAGRPELESDRITCISTMLQIVTWLYECMFDIDAPACDIGKVSSACQFRLLDVESAKFARYGCMPDIHVESAKFVSAAQRYFSTPSVVPPAADRNGNTSFAGNTTLRSNL